MHATGGGEIAVRLKDEVNETRASRKEHKKPIIDFKKYFDGKESTGVSRSQDESDKIESIASEIDKWSKRFSAEFSLGDEPTPATLQSAQIPKFLRDAKSTNDKKNIAAWFRPTLNQRDPYSPELRDQAIALEAFQKIVGDLPPEDLPKRLRDISQALYTFSKSTTQTTQDQEDSRKFIADEFKKSTPPPDDYETLTVKDAERLELIQNILDRLKYGFVVPDQPKAENKRSKWTTINNHIARGIDLTKESKIMDPEIVLLRALEKSFGSSQKK
jgi:hypothetical protein